MEHADFLSRNPLSDSVVNVVHNELGSDTHDPIKRPKSVNFVELRLGWLVVEQKRDNEIQDLITKHNICEIPEAAAHTYDVPNNVLYRKI